MSLDLTDDKLTLVQVMAWCRQALRWMSLELADDKSTLVQVMAWCRQATSHYLSQVEWWLEHRHGWLVKPQWAGSVLGRVTRYEYQVLGSTSIPARLDTLVYWEPFSWLTSVGTTRNTVIRLGWSRIGLAVLNLHAAGVGLIGRPAVISGRYNKCHSLQLQNHYAHFPPLHHTHIHAKHNRAEPVMGNGYGFRGIVCWPWQEKSCVIG